MNNKVYIPTHLDIGNRGCEGIAKGTVQILADYEVCLFSRNCGMDSQIGDIGGKLYDVGKISCLREKIYRAVKKLAVGNKKLKRYLEYRMLLPNFIDAISKEQGDAVVLITGGDLFCYDDNYVIYVNRFIKKNSKIKTVLWGCSVGEENLSKAKIKSLMKFDYIVSRESITEAMLIDKLNLKKVKRFPDPAFAVEATKVDVELKFALENCIGINLSNFVSSNFEWDSPWGENVANLFKYIFEETDMNIVLIPHVFWDGQDDRIVCNAIFERYKNSNRIDILKSEEMNYCQIRYVIGQCRFFIGARTHSMISAYSMCVPALALGYSVKSLGIAKDLGLPKELVVDYRNVKSCDELKKAFSYLVEHEYEMRKQLRSIVPSYRNEAFGASEIIKKIVG